MFSFKMFKGQDKFRIDNDKKEAIEIIRNSGYHLPDQIAHNTSLKDLKCVSFTLIMHNNMISDEKELLNLDTGNGDTLLFNENNDAKIVTYSYYFAQFFVNMIFNERMGNYLYENKENLEYDMSYHNIISLFIDGLIMIRELEDITYSYLYCADKEKFESNIEVLGLNTIGKQLMVNDIFDKQSMNDENAPNQFNFRYRGLNLTVFFAPEEKIVKLINHMIRIRGHNAIKVIPPLTKEQVINVVKSINNQHISTRASNDNM